MTEIDLRIETWFSEKGISEFHATTLLRRLLLCALCFLRAAGFESESRTINRHIPFSVAYLPVTSNILLVIGKMRNKKDAAGVRVYGKIRIRGGFAKANNVEIIRKKIVKSRNDRRRSRTNTKRELTVRTNETSAIWAD